MVRGGMPEPRAMGVHPRCSDGEAIAPAVRKRFQPGGGGRASTHPLPPLGSERRAVSMTVAWLVHEITLAGGRVVMYAENRARLARQLRRPPLAGSRFPSQRARWIADAVAEAQLDRIIDAAAAAGRIVVTDSLPPILKLAGQTPPGEPDAANGAPAPARSGGNGYHRRPRPRLLAPSAPPSSWRHG